jgi:2-phosphosulfolactate phosphatase
LGSFLNLSAVVASLQGAARIDILCAGTDGAESREDILAAGAIVEMLTANVSSDWQLDEGATEALAQWRSRGDDLAFDLRSTPGGRNLLEIGMDDDLVDCARIDTLAVVPELNVSTWQITAG